jgi:N-acetylglucosaminyl-diphospho-decaprenol L-rhamnosyltransferase
MSDRTTGAERILEPRVSIIIVTYRSTEEIPGCIEGILRQTVPVEIFLVDNASPDDTPQMVRNYAERFGNIHAILNNSNLGLAAGNNCPLGQCRGEYVLILNPDTLLPDDSLQKMVKFLDEHPDVGVIGPQNRYQDGSRHVSFHRHWGLLHVLLWRIVPYRFPRLLYDRFSSYKLQDVLFVSGSCLLTRRNIYEQIGGYDPEYFLTVEDVADLCIRARATGSRVVFYPGAEIVHLTGRSGAQAPYIAVWEGVRGTIYHFQKHKGYTQAFLVWLLLAMATGARAALAGVLSIGMKSYRRTFRIYAKVFWNLLAENPLWRGSSRPKSSV